MSSPEKEYSESRSAVCSRATFAGGAASQVLDGQAGRGRQDEGGPTRANAGGAERTMPIRMPSAKLSRDCKPSQCFANAMRAGAVGLAANLARRQPAEPERPLGPVENGCASFRSREAAVGHPPCNPQTTLRLAKTLGDRGTMHTFLPRQGGERPRKGGACAREGSEKIKERLWRRQETGSER